MDGSGDLPDDYYPLFGLPEEDSRLLFISNLPSTKRVEFKSKGGTEVYVQCKCKGICFLFTSGLLDGVFLYKGGNDGYSAYHGALPHGLNMDMTNAQVVTLLGEPQSKAPYEGIMPIWIEYTKIGLNITFTTHTYNDNKNPLSIVLLFPPKP